MVPSSVEGVDSQYGRLVRFVSLTSMQPTAADGEEIDAPGARGPARNTVVPRSPFEFAGCQ